MAHFIAGVGTDVRTDCGCFAQSVHDTPDDAVSYLAELFELGRVGRARLRRDRFLQMRGPVDGASYVEIIKCDCADRDQHEDG
jgi:hypothetical protein